MSKCRRSFTVAQRAEIIQRYDSDRMSELSLREAALKLDVPPSTLCRILHSRQTIDQIHTENDGSRKRKRDGKSKEVDQALLLWFRQANKRNAAINRGILLQKANELAMHLNIDFNSTDGWLSRWKRRHGIVYQKVQAQKQDPDAPMAGQWVKEVWPSILKSYNPEDIYNADEAGLYYRATPDRFSVFKNAKNSGCKKLSDHLTVLLTCNMTGSVKRKPLVIGKSRNPRCFKGVKKLPTLYENNKNAWMTSPIFEGYLNSWNAELRKAHKRIALILDNCIAHPEVQYTNIKLFFLPPNTSAIIQPLNQGIIKTFKTYFRSHQCKRLIEEIERRPDDCSQVAKALTVLDALHLTMEAWDNVGTDCIQNCFIRAFRDNNEKYEVDEEVDKDLSEWITLDETMQTSEHMTDADIANFVRTGNDCTLMREDDDDDDDDNDDEEQEEPMVTKMNVVDCLRVVRRYCEQIGYEEGYRFLYKINSAVYNHSDVNDVNY